MKADIQAFVAKHSGTRRSLIPILEEVQAKYGYLSPEALKVVAHETGRPLVDIYNVATFYRAFSLKPRGKHLVTVCLGTACHVRGGPAVAEAFERHLGCKRGDMTEDKEFTLETVNCLGACALAPVTVVDGHYFPKMKIASIKGVLKRSCSSLDGVSAPVGKEAFPVDVSCPRCSHTLMDSKFLIDGKPSVKVSISFGQTLGWLRLSSLYGSFQIESEYPIPHTELVHFFCSDCHTELMGGTRCLECGIPMVPMVVRGGGIVQICPRRGCRGHILDLVGNEVAL